MTAERMLVELPSVLGVDLSITPNVAMLLAAAVITYVVLAIACRRRGLVAHGCVPNLFEQLIEYIEEQVVREGIGQDGKRWTSLLLTLFFFILFCDLLGMVPMPGTHQALTANINVTAALALIVFALTLGIGLGTHGIRGFARKFVPSGLPPWIYLLVVPIEFISWLTKPISLAIRLFANMLVGHALVLTFITMLATTAWFAKSLPLVGAVAMAAFEIFVSFIQAFIFTMLAGLYISEALQEAH